MSSPNPAKIKSNFKLPDNNLELTTQPRHSQASPKKEPQFKVPLIPDREDPKAKKDAKNPRGIFILFLLSNLLINYDGGVIPASLVQIETELKITYTQEAALGSVVYIGLSAASLFVSVTFRKFQAKNILGFTMLIKAICCGLFSYFSNLMLLYVCRILMGVTQAFPVIYAPVWVNEFSPKEKSTTWMGLLHGFVPIGIMLGFVIAGFIINFFPTLLSWRFAFQIQAACELPIAILFFLQDNRKIDVLAQEKEQARLDRKAEASLSSAERNIRIDAINYDAVKHTWEQVKKVLGNKTLILTCLSLCSLFYVVTGVQYWSSMYMIKILKMSPENAMISFGIIAISAPIAGVFVGGSTSDSLGGYKGDNLLTAVKLCTAYSIVAFLVSMPLSFTTKLWFFIPLLWSMLLFGACIIPIATGITVDCVPREYQAANSSFSQLVYNIFGYFLAPVLSALIMDQFDNQEEGLLWGFRSVLWFSLFGVFFMMLHWFIISNNESYKEMPEESMSRAEIDFEVARRRAVSYL